MGKRWKELRVGDKFISPDKTITDAHISTIIGLSGFIASFFVDEEYANRTVFGGRVAPGRLTLLLMGGLFEQTDIFDVDQVIALVGLDKMRLRAPLRAGDTITVESEIIEKRQTSKPDRGIIVHMETCWNQKGEVIAEMEVTHLLRF